MQQDGFQIIIGIVGGENAVLPARGQVFEKQVPDIPAALFQTQPLLASQSGHIFPQNFQPQAVPLGKSPANLLVPLGFLPPQLMVHMGQHQPPGVHFPQQPVAQGGGVRPAGKPHYDQALLGQAGEIPCRQKLTHGG